VKLAEGKYKVFYGEGEMPQVVIDLWGQVWQYFASEGAEERAYTTDYEWYETYGKVHVYIAIK
jgi:predicted transcriptional regulator YdeE